MFSVLPFSYMFMMVMVMGTLLSVSSFHWLSIWAGLEINLIGFLPLLVYQKSTSESESAVKYFIVQALGSSMLIFGSLIAFNMSFTWDMYAGNLSHSAGLLIIVVGLMYKISVVSLPLLASYGNSSPTVNYLFAFGHLTEICALVSFSLFTSVKGVLRASFVLMCNYGSIYSCWGNRSNKSNTDSCIAGMFFNWTLSMNNLCFTPYSVIYKILFIGLRVGLFIYIYYAVSCRFSNYKGYYKVKELRISSDKGYIIFTVFSGTYLLYYALCLSGWSFWSAVVMSSFLCYFFLFYVLYYVCFITYACFSQYFYEMYKSETLGPWYYNKTKYRFSFSCFIYFSWSGYNCFYYPFLYPF
uniref:NADH-ubiquinone oxidoreductase chain 2 n=1 Tax=Concholepas concholepas TaxID=137544 RepID=H9D1C0_CONCC|nr:NADH dehydrogenase subunit 2 [Concholepas concholepas]AFC65057.1 NADH dehydrogenase subunit 2 [Concholepas concholepas]